MAYVPREFYTEAFVLNSGTGFDDYGTPTHTGTLVSGTGYLKETERYELTNAGPLAILDLELWTDPEAVSPNPGDKVTAGGSEHRIGSVRTLRDQDGFKIADISKLTETRSD